MRRLLVVLVSLCACRAGFRSQGGAAMSPDGMGKGASHSLVFYDEGGILTRAGLGALLTMAAPTVYDDVYVTRTTTVTDHNDGTKTKKITTTTEGNVNEDRAKALQHGFDAVGDPHYHLGTANGAFAAGLEIAGTTLGGDTSGGQFDLGYSYHRLGRFGPGGVGFRFYGGLGYGHFTFHGRLLDAMDRGPPMFGDGTYAFLGIPTRAGVFLLLAGDSLTKMVAVEGYGKANINFDGKSVYHLGGRFQYWLLYVEAEMSASSSEDRSYGLEIGLGI